MHTDIPTAATYTAYYRVSHWNYNPYDRSPTTCYREPTANRNQKPEIER